MDPANAIAPRARAFVRAFTLIDVLVTVAIVAVLIGVMLPSISGVQETARRLACRSNVRQIMLGAAMYADQNAGTLPPSAFLPFTVTASLGGPATSSSGNLAPRPQEMQVLRMADEEWAAVLTTPKPWDGLGLLYDEDYLPASKIFFCPSHRGTNSFQAFALMFETSGSAMDEIVGNYHYRGFGPLGHDSTQRTTKLYQIEPQRSSLISDGMRTQADNNHRVGTNLARADLSVEWFSDSDGVVDASLPKSKQEARDMPDAVVAAWRRYDQPVADFSTRINK